MKAIPRIPGSRGRNCAKGPATLNQINDPDRILYPLKRAGKRGEGKWERTTWDEALDDHRRHEFAKQSSKIAANEIMYHVGRPGEDGFTERILAAWGVDGHNSHTNICSSGSREGYQLWMGLDRPSPDHANAKVILLISAHLESGHYFNPHAQRVIDGKANGAKLIVFDTRLSNTATHADYWVAPYPGSEAAMLLAIANYLIQNNLYNREFVRRWWNWEEYLAVGKDSEAAPATIERPNFRKLRDSVLKETLQRNTPSNFAAQESGVEREDDRRDCQAGRHRRHAFFQSQLAQRLFRRQRRLVRRARALHVQRAARRDRDRRRRLSQRLEQVCAEADLHAAASEDVERNNLAARVSALDERDVVSAAASFEGRPRQTRCLFHARLQPGLDQPRRLLVDRSAD